MKNILIIVLLVWFFTGCSETETEHTYVTIQKEDQVTVVDFQGLVQEFLDRDSGLNDQWYDENSLYVVFHFSADTYSSIILDMKLTCGAKHFIDYYSSVYVSDNNDSLEYGALAAFTKQSLIDNNCLQEGGQIESLFSEVEGYAEYSPDKVTTVQHYVSSNTIEYTAQEINEAFAVFE
ncbi:MAG: hypothetical protein ABFR02_10100, partial [Campylobacterota bacterium]